MSKRQLSKSRHRGRPKREDISPGVAASPKASPAVASHLLRQLEDTPDHASVRASAVREVMALHSSHGNAEVQGLVIQRQPAATEEKAVPAVEMNDDELVHGIVDGQLAILEGWETALHNFNKVLSSASDKDAEADLKGVIVSFFADKIMGAIGSATKSGEVVSLLGKLDEEYKRATAAGESAQLRDFFVSHLTAVGKLKQAILPVRAQMLARVRKLAEGISEKDDEATGRWAMARDELMTTYASVNDTLKRSSPEALFRLLSEEWIQKSKYRGAMGSRHQAKLRVRLNYDFSIRDAEIVGPGGQKIAEQLLKDTPGGVDVLTLRVPRDFVYYRKGESWPYAVVRLGPRNQSLNQGSIAEGQFGEISREIFSRGLARVTKLEGAEE